MQTDVHEQTRRDEKGHPSVLFGLLGCLFVHHQIYNNRTTGSAIACYLVS